MHAFLLLIVIVTASVNVLQANTLETYDHTVAATVNYTKAQSERRYLALREQMMEYRQINNIKRRRSAVLSAQVNELEDLASHFEQLIDARIIEVCKISDQAGTRDSCDIPYSY